MIDTPDPRLVSLPGHDTSLHECRAIRDWLCTNADNFGDRTAVYGIDRSALNHRQLHELVENVAEDLLDAGIGQGDVVVIGLHNGPEALTAILAVASVAVAFPVGPEEPIESVERLLNQVPVKAVLYDDRRASSLKTIGSRHGLLSISVEVAQGRPAGLFSMTCPEVPRSERAHPTKINDASVLVKTAGTTSEPKIVAWSQASLYLSASCAAEWMGLTDQDRSLCVMPFSHLHSVVRSTMPGLLRGGSVVCCPGVDRIHVLNWIVDYKPTYMTAVPGAYRTILSAAGKTDRNQELNNTSLRFLATGSDSIDPLTVESLGETFGVPVREFYGMSEVSPMLAASPPGVEAHANGAVGKPLKLWKVRITGTDSSELPPATEGEIAVGGGLINPIVSPDAANERQRTDYWYLTGDVGWIDEDGYLHVTGRADDRITRGGKKISPATVEETLQTYQGVTKAIAFPIPDQVLGERVAALVVPDKDVSPLEQDMRFFVANVLPDYMVPDRIIVSSHIPLSQSGKVMRRQLAELVGIEPRGSHASPARRPPESKTEAALSGIVGGLLDMDELDLDADFTDLGADSFFAISLLVAVEDRFGVALSPAQLLKHNTVASLARIVDGPGNDDREPLILMVKEGTKDAPIFFAHSVDGFAYYAQTFARHVDSNQTVYAFQWQNERTRISTAMTLEAHASRYVEAMLEIQPSGPYFLAGHSFGGNLAYEVAQQLWKHGREVAYLALLDSRSHLSERYFGISRSPLFGRKLRDRFKRLGRAYVPESYPGKITFFQAQWRPEAALADHWQDWRYLAINGIDKVVLPGDHQSIMQEQQITRWIGVFMEHMNKAKQEWTNAGFGARNAKELTEAAHEYNSRDHVREATLARRAGRAGDLQAEISHYQEAIRFDPAQPYWVYRNLGDALLQRGAPAAAESAYRSAVDREEVPIISLGRLAQLYMSKGRAQDARLCAEEAARFNTEEAHSLSALGDVFSRVGDWERSASAYRKAIELRPLNSKAHYKLSRVTEQQHRLDIAVGLAHRAVTLKPGNIRFMYNWARLLAKNGSLGPARRAFSQSILLLSRSWLADTRSKTTAHRLLLSNWLWSVKSAGWRALRPQRKSGPETCSKAGMD